MSKLRIAVQKSGRLNEDSMKILKDIGIAIDNGKDQLKAAARNFPVEVFYLRNGVYPTDNQQKIPQGNPSAR